MVARSTSARPSPTSVTPSSIPVLAVSYRLSLLLVPAPGTPLLMATPSVLPTEGVSLLKYRLLLLLLLNFMFMFNYKIQTYENVLVIISLGMDMKQGREGGTWLGISKKGKFAAVTTYRQAPKFLNPNAKGKGHLVTDFLTGETSVTDYLECISSVGDKYNGFNLLVGDLQEDSKSAVGWYCNVENKEVRRLTPGTYALSNRVLDCSWPKMVYGKERFTEILKEGRPKQELIDELLLLLNNRQRFVESYLSTFGVSYRKTKTCIGNLFLETSTLTLSFSE